MRSKLIKMRRQAGYTQYTIASIVGVSRSHYQQIENGVKNPSLSLAIKIKDALNYKEDDIFYNQKSPVSGRRGRPSKRYKPLSTTLYHKKEQK